MQKILGARIRKLRHKGKSYGEIKDLLGSHLSKSSISYWCRGLVLNKSALARLDKIRYLHLPKARDASIVSKKIKQQRRVKAIEQANQSLLLTITVPDIAKIALAMLFLGEGTKNPKRASLVFGNSDPGIIALFLRLLRKCFVLHENKFRCTVQCRADQNTVKLEKFWSNVTNIPSKQFYKSRIDARSIGRSSRKPDYKGVCRIDYFSSYVFNELLYLSRMIVEGP